ncbi:hypothetical protein Pvag_pPag20122 (plasmid) [Pantoea vagans C9-1]|nr:hypothetical protein Pvag_pPag20122 [Pantoea vagans C9-1]
MGFWSQCARDQCPCPLHAWSGSDYYGLCAASAENYLSLFPDVRAAEVNAHLTLNTATAVSSGCSFLFRAARY